MARARTASGGDDQARAVIDWLQRFGRYHPILTDTAIAAGVALIGVPSLRHHQQWGIALTVALCLPLVLRRRYPRAVFGTITLVLLVQWLIDVQLGADLALLVSLYTVAAVSSSARASRSTACSEIELVREVARELGRRAQVRFRMRPRYLELQQPLRLLRAVRSTRRRRSTSRASRPTS